MNSQTALPRSRTRILAAIIVLMMAIFAVRLFQLQVLEHNTYARLANNEQMRQWVKPASRGEIFVMDGDKPMKLVHNETVYTLWADPQVIKDANEVAALVGKLDDEKLVDNVSERLAKTETRYQILARNVTSREARDIKDANLYGVGFTPSERRFYPEGSLASQVLGFVNLDGEGQYGVESQLDKELKGTDGLLKTIADVRNVPLTIGDSNVDIPAIDGKDVVLTIDRNIQRQAEKLTAEGAKKIGAEYGSMLVMDPRSGKVLAMANVPTYDPGDLNAVKDIEYLNNRIISRPYEPASVIKTVAMATGVDAGVMTPNTTYTNTDRVVIDGWQIQNASKGQTGEIDMQRVLNWSLNTGTVEMAKWLGGGNINRQARDTMYSYYHDKFRFGEYSGIELAGEAKGTLVSPQEVEGNAIRYANMTFGQGMNVTPLQVGAAFSAVINGGKYCQPTVVAGEMKNSQFVARESGKCDQVIKASTSATMREMIHEARQAFYGSSDRKGYQIGGKTGTAQAAEDGKYVFSTTEGTYIGFGATPGEEPAYVILVTFSKQGKKIDGQMTIPTFTDMSNWMIEYLKLTPKG